MKVSKTLREYIEEQVNIKADNSIVNLKVKADEAIAKFKAEAKVLEAEWTETWKATLQKYKIEPKFYLIRVPDTHVRDLPEVEAYRKAESELREKQRLAVLNIIAEMELGGTKAELVEKLNNLTF